MIEAKDLKGKAAIVVGGTRGIGGAISRILAERGAGVAAFYQSREDEAQQFASEIGTNGAAPMPYDATPAIRPALTRPWTWPSRGSGASTFSCSAQG